MGKEELKATFMNILFQKESGYCLLKEESVKTDYLYKRKVFKSVILERGRIEWSPLFI